MTKREVCKKNKQMFLDKVHSTAQWQEAERLIEEHSKLFKAGRIDEANKLFWKIKRLKKEAKEVAR